MKSRRNRDMRTSSLRVGVDTGGTFTDFVYESDGHLNVFKLASTPQDPSVAILEGLRRIADSTSNTVLDFQVVHGTTVGTNALLQRKGARTALVTTKGFEDVLAIGRQARPELYNLNAVKPPPLVEEALRFGIDERIDCAGTVLVELSDADTAALLRRLRSARVESIAISLLFSFAYPHHERRIATALEELGIPLSVSHQILPEYREFERTSTVTINAYLQPLMGRYLNRLSSGRSAAQENPKIKERSLSLRVMQSSGGSISAKAAADEPVRTILSGPAGGVVGALRSARSAGFEQVITFDMGGTSTDVALCDQGGLRMTNEAVVAGLPVAVSVMDIHTVGAGGGSIARVDAGGSLRVGPESAGADPGPACYGKSLLPTVTDAHVVLGHFGGGGLLGGEFTLDEARSHEALTALAAGMSKAARQKISTTTAAQGVLSVVNTNMERALRHISIERGYDSRDFALLPFGGAGGLHAVDLARALRMSAVIVPVAGGALSAIGVLVADVIKDQSRTVMLEVKAGIGPALDNAFNELERSASAALTAEGFTVSQQRHERSLAMRYKGQSFELEIKTTRGKISAAFHQTHRARYGYADEKNPIEIVSVRLRSSGIVPKLKQRQISGVKRGRIMKPNTETETFLAGVRVRAGVYTRAELSAGLRLQSPCIVTEYSATTLIPESAAARIDEYGNMIIELK